MAKLPIHFYCENIVFNIPFPPKFSEWIKFVIEQEDHSLGILNFIFTNDDTLLNINLQYLNHNSLTDIITFNNSDKNQVIEGDIFISVDRIQENSLSLQIPFSDELHRVIIHGILHLIGYDDKDISSKNLMTQKENFYLNLRKF